MGRHSWTGHPTIALGVIVLVLSMGCGMWSPHTPGGRTHEVVIADGLSATEVTVQTGDEIRWTNRHGATVHMVFLDPIDENVIRSHGFGLAGVINGRYLKANDTLMLCFGSPGSYRYTVKLDHATSAGSFNVMGYIHVEPSPNVQAGEAAQRKS